MNSDEVGVMDGKKQNQTDPSKCLGVYRAIQQDEDQEGGREGALVS
jgi:hypothetical protein